MLTHKQPHALLLLSRDTQIRSRRQINDCRKLSFDLARSASLSTASLSEISIPARRARERSLSAQPESALAKSSSTWNKWSPAAKRSGRGRICVYVCPELLDFACVVREICELPEWRWDILRCAAAELAFFLSLVLGAATPKRAPSRRGRCAA